MFGSSIPLFRIKLERPIFLEHINIIELDFPTKHNIF